MIRRTYFYSAKTPVRDGTNQMYCGEIHIKSWFPKKDVYRTITEHLQKHYKQDNLIFVAMNRLK